MRLTLAKSGRPRISVDIELIQRLREREHFGWGRMVHQYCICTGQKISRDTLRRRYLEELLDRLERRDGKKRCRFAILRYGTQKKKKNTPNLTRCNWKPSKRKTALPHLH